MFQILTKETVWMCVFFIFLCIGNEPMIFYHFHLSFAKWLTVCLILEDNPYEWSFFFGVAEIDCRVLRNQLFFILGAPFFIWFFFSQKEKL